MCYIDDLPPTLLLSYKENKDPEKNHNATTRYTQTGEQLETSAQVLLLKPMSVIFSSELQQVGISLGRGGCHAAAR